MPVVSYPMLPLVPVNVDCQTKVRKVVTVETTGALAEHDRQLTSSSAHWTEMLVQVDHNV